MNSLGSAARFPFPFPLLVKPIGLRLLATAANAALVRSPSLPPSSSGLNSNPEKVVPSLCLGVLDGPGDAPLARFSSFTGDDGRDCRRARGCGLSGGMVEDVI